MVVATVTGCRFPHCFNLVQSSGQLGQFAGVLTALTFSAIIFLAGRDKDQHEGIEDTLKMFLAAFISMTLATYLYTGAASEEVTGARASFEGFCAALALTVALQQLFMGICQLVHGRRFVEVRRFAARLGGCVVGPLVMVFMAATVVNSAYLHAPESAAWSSWLALLCLALLGALVCGLALAWFAPRIGLSGIGDSWPARWAMASLVIVVFSAVLTVIWAEQNADASMPSAGYGCIMIVLFLSTLSFDVLLLDMARSERPAPRKAIVDSGHVQPAVVPPVPVASESDGASTPG